MYTGGAFPRTESGRTLTLRNADDSLRANYCRGSRKDLRGAVEVARKAQGGWAARAAFNRSQILYRIGEILESRRAQFERELAEGGMTATAAQREVDEAIDTWVYYAGWADKVQQVFGSINPVSSAHFNFSALEPSGVAFLAAPDAPSLSGLAATLAPLICGGNTVIVLASATDPVTAISFAEVLNASDVPGGVVNILTGNAAEIVPHAAKHMDINTFVCARSNDVDAAALEIASADNMKRFVRVSAADLKAAQRSPYAILDGLEVKTTWHPIGL